MYSNTTTSYYRQLHKWKGERYKKDIQTEKEKYNPTKKKRKKPIKQTIVYKTQYRKYNTKQHEAHRNRFITGAPEG